MQSRWSDEDARGLDALGLRVHTSRLIGAEPALVLHGGGNTSVKLDDRDHRGRPCRALAIKGSGSDLRTIEAADFARLRLDDLQALRPRTEMPDDDMVAYLARSVLDPNAPRPSIETLLHAFLPDAWVDHSHTDAVLALTNQADGHRLLREVYGDRVAIVPYVLPGFRLAQLAADVYAAHPGVEGLVLDMHGLVTFGADGAGVVRAAHRVCDLGGEACPVAPADKGNRAWRSRGGGQAGASAARRALYLHRGSSCATTGRRACAPSSTGPTWSRSRSKARSRPTTCCARSDCRWSCEPPIQTECPRLRCRLPFGLRALLG